MLLIVLIQGCTVLLAPEHELAIVFGLKELASQTESPFADLVTNGVYSAGYAALRAEQYDALVGKARGLVILIGGRPGS